MSTLNPTSPESKEPRKTVYQPDVHTRRIIRFLKDCCLIEPEEIELNKLLYLEYVQWAIQNQFIQLGKKGFGYCLSGLGFETTMIRNGYYRIGLCLKKFVIPEGLASLYGSDLTEYTRQLIQK